MTSSATPSRMKPMEVEVVRDVSDLRVVGSSANSWHHRILNSAALKVVAALALIAALVAVIVVMFTGPGSPVKQSPSMDRSAVSVLGSNLLFVSIGDWGRNSIDNQAWVAGTFGQWVDAAQPTFIVSTGDNFYENGVDNVTDPQFATSFMNVYTHPALKSRPWYIIYGNHDYRSNLTAQLVFNADARWSAPGLNYSRTWQLSPPQPSVSRACVSAVFVDTVPFIKSYTTNPDTDGMRRNLINSVNSSKAQLAWLDQQLATAVTLCNAVIVIGHHPVYSGGDHHDAPDLITAFLPLFQRYNVDAYIAGHDHTLIHLKAENTQFIVSGGGSRIRNNTVVTPETVWFKDTNGFVFHSFNTSHAQHTFINGSGSIIYRFVVPLNQRP